jgi:hypothetical protein
MYAIFYKGEFIAAYKCAIAASLIAINRFTSGQIIRGEVDIHAVW